MALSALDPGVDAIAAFALTALVIELTPGPNMAWLAIVAATDGRRSGFAAVAGVATGLAIIGLAAALGLAALIAASPLAYQLLRWGGVIYLLWLAWDGWRDGGALPGDGGNGRAAISFRRGLVTNLLNPKAAVFYVAVLPGFIEPGTRVIQASVILSLVYVAVATAVHAAIVLAADAARRVFDEPRHERLLRRALSIALALIALWFAWKTRHPI